MPDIAFLLLGAMCGFIVFGIAYCVVVEFDVSDRIKRHRSYKLGDGPSQRTYQEERLLCILHKAPPSNEDSRWCEETAPVQGRDIIFRYLCDPCVFQRFMFDRNGDMLMTTWFSTSSSSLSYLPSAP